MQKATVLLLALLLLLPLSTAQDAEGSQEDAAQREVDIATRCGGTGDSCNEPAGELCCRRLKCVNSRCCPTTDGC
uniref:Conotoxin ca17a n=1 Tax=Conus caracteristicus TaxID=89440 RepID=CXY17_CONCB|nr:RecName: Full=Conotoxin ca17a; AltName: Full=Conotoxin ca16a; Flags: Precursor [Conus caracteristicus]ACF93417.1 ca16a [Conus caracteristicus]